MPKIAPAAVVARSALFTYLTPRLAQDAQINYNSLVSGVTSRNYEQRRGAIAQAVRTATKGKLAQDADIMDLANLLDALSPSAQQADAEVGMPMQAPPPQQQQAQVPPNSGPPMAQVPQEDADEPGDLIAKVKAYLEEQGVAPEILQNLDAFLAVPENPKPDVGDPAQEQPADPENQPEAPPPKKEGEDNALAGQTAIHGLDGEMPPLTGLDNELEDMVPNIDPVNQPSILGSGENPTIVTSDEWEEEDEEEAEDGVIPETQEGQVVTKTAMDAAIKQAQDAAIKNQRNIRNAERFVRPWVGDLAMDAAHPADVYRATLKALGMDGKKVDRLHQDALVPILEAQPRPTTRRVPVQRPGMAADAKPEGSFLDRFPMASNIRVN